MRDLEALARKLASQSVDFEDAVDEVMEMLTPDEYKMLARPLVEDACRRVYRDRVRAIEYRYDEALLMSADPLAARRLLLAETFRLRDGTRVEWGAATAEQHRQRADMQRENAAGCLRDASRHEDAAITIEAAGVTCLDDLEEDAA